MLQYLGMNIVFAVIINVLLVILVLGILIFVHELGHFILAKLNNVLVDEFSLGMGPKIWSFKKGETEYSLRAFPIGGYVSILGEVESEDPEEKKIALESPRSFLNKKWWQKLSILLAGVSFNFLLAAIIYYILLLPLGNALALPDNVADEGLWFGKIERVITDEYVTYDELSDDGNALEAGWPASGTIYSVNDEKVSTSKDLIDLVQSNKGNNLSVRVCTDEELQMCELYSTPVSDEGYLGIMLNSNYYYQVHYEGLTGVFSGFAHSLNTIQLSVRSIVDVFDRADQSGDYSEAVNTLGGPVALYFIVDYVKDLGVVGVAGLVATLSLTLMVMNLLPIPALDGGRVVLVLVREILGDKFSHKLEAWLVGVSYAALMLLMLAIVIKDVVFIGDFKELIDSLK